MLNLPEGIRELYRFPGFFDPFSAISHLLGAALFLVLGAFLLRRGRGDHLRFALLFVYSISCVFLFSMSGVYHMMANGGTARAVMARLDHAAIFVMIAASFTPLHGLLFQGWLRWVPLVFVWVAAVVAITLKTIFFDNLAEWVGLTLYLTLGWLGVVSGVLVARRRGFEFVAPLFWGGVAYSVGGLIDFLNRPVLFSGVIQAHELFHVAVLIGAFLHFMFIWQITTEATLDRQMAGASLATSRSAIVRGPLWKLERERI